MKLIDLSVPMEPSPRQPQTIEVTHMDHKEGSPSMQATFECSVDDLPMGLGWAVDTLKLSTHAGTHVDTPWHYTL